MQFDIEQARALVLHLVDVFGPDLLEPKPLGEAM